MSTGFDLESIPAALRPAIEEKIERMAATAAVDDLDAGVRAALPRVWMGSEFVADTCLRDQVWELARAGGHLTKPRRRWLGDHAGAIVADADRSAVSVRTAPVPPQRLHASPWREPRVSRTSKQSFGAIAARRCVTPRPGTAGASSPPATARPRADGPAAAALLGMGRLAAASSFLVGHRLVFLFASRRDREAPRTTRVLHRLGLRVAQLLGSTH